MGLVYCDGMDLAGSAQITARYDFTENADGTYAKVQDSLNPTSVTQAWCYQISAAGTNSQTRLFADFPSASAAWLGIGANVISVLAASASATILAVRGSNNSAVAALLVIGSTAASVAHFGLNLNISGTSGASTTVTFSTGTWHRIELAVSLGRTGTGVVQAYVSGLLVLSFTGTVCNQMTRGYYGTGNTTRFDDFYICTSLTSGPLSVIGSTFLVRTLLPISDATVSWNVFGATCHVSAIASYGSAGHDSDTTYVHTSALSAVDLFELTDYSQLSGWAASTSEYPVAALLVGAVRYTSTAASVRMKLVQASGGASVTGTTSAASTAYMYHRFALNSDPGGASWTLAVLSGLQAAVDYVSQN